MAEPTFDGVDTFDRTNEFQIVKWTRSCRAVVITASHRWTMVRRVAKRVAA